VRVTIDPHVTAADPRLREDSQLGALIKMIRTLTGPSFNPSRVCFRHSAPRETGYYYELFRCPIEFDAASTSMLIARADAEKRLTGANDQLAQLNEHIVVQYLAHRAKHDIVNRVKAAIIDSLASGSANEAHIAEALHMTPRNMHRRLSKEETSFRQLLNDVRQDLALQYIQDRSKTLTEISFLLGFSEVSSFSRAFKNWTGKPPSEARRDVA
jgi:AraC-like DNA-binding protein